MNKNSPRENFKHLLNILSSDRFLKMEIRRNDVPFFIADYKIEKQDEMLDVIEKLKNNLSDKKIKVLDINLYDLSNDILKKNGDWDWYMENETSSYKDVLKEEFQAILDVQNIIAPAIAEKLTTDYDILFITGVGEVFPYIRSHNVLNNLQKFAKDKPLVFFFPGEYTMYEDTSSNLKLFSILPDDKYYRATNIYEIDEV